MQRRGGTVAIRENADIAADLKGASDWPRGQQKPTTLPAVAHLKLPRAKLAPLHTNALELKFEGTS